MLKHAFYAFSFQQCRLFVRLNFCSYGVRSGSNDIMFCFDEHCNALMPILIEQQSSASDMMLMIRECHLELDFWSKFFCHLSSSFCGDFYQIRMAAINCPPLLALWVLHLSCCRKWPQPTAGHILTPTQLHRQPLHTLASAGPLPCPFSSEYLHKEICVHIGCICFGLFWLDRSQSLFNFVPQEFQSQAGSTTSGGRSWAQLTSRWYHRVEK